MRAMTDDVLSGTALETTPDISFYCALLEELRIEVLPTVELDKVIAAVPPKATLAVTSSPAHGVQGTLTTALALRQHGYRVVPHLAARALRSHQDLASLWQQYVATGIDEVSVVGGDQTEPAGEFPDSRTPLTALLELLPGPRRTRIAADPEGHPHIPADVLEADLLTKQARADYAITQLVFDPDALVRWLTTMRSRGYTLPLYLCLPGTLRLDRLIRIGLRLGLGTSLRYPEKQRGLLGRLLTGGIRSDPSDFFNELARRPAAIQGGIVGIDWSRFNALTSVVEWIHAKRARLGCPGEGVRT